MLIPELHCGGDAFPIVQEKWKALSDDASLRCHLPLRNRRKWCCLVEHGFWRLALPVQVRRLNLKGGTLGTGMTGVQLGEGIAVYCFDISVVKAGHVMKQSTLPQRGEDSN